MVQGQAVGGKLVFRVSDFCLWLFGAWTEFG